MDKRVADFSLLYTEAVVWVDDVVTLTVQSRPAFS